MTPPARVKPGRDLFEIFPDLPWPRQAPHLLAGRLTVIARQIAVARHRAEIVRMHQRAAADRIRSAVRARPGGPPAARSGR